MATATDNQRSWMAMAHLSRGALGILILTAIALIVPPQTKDMLANLSDFGGDGFWPTLAFQVALFVLAFNLWHWTRAALAARFEVTDTMHARRTRTRTPDSRGQTVNALALNVLPRLLFVAGAGIGVIAALRSAAWVQLTITIAWAAIGTWLLVQRLRIQKRFGVENLMRGGDPTTPRWVPHFFRPAWRALDLLLRHAPMGAWPAGAILLVAVTLMTLGAVATFVPLGAHWAPWPVLLGQILPGPSAALFCLGTTVGPLTVLTFIFDQSTTVWNLFGHSIPMRRIPVLFALAVVMTVTPAIVNLHAVRIADDAATHGNPDKRLSLAFFFRDWVEQCAPVGTVRPVIVSISGGASRAAVWGARVLVAVDDASREQGAKFRWRQNGPQPFGAPSIFAISSVSGGSLGAAAYITLRRSETTPCALPALPPATQQMRDLVLMDGIRRDALGPVLAGTLFGDAPRALFGLPVAALQWVWAKISGHTVALRGGDRAEALERAFEQNWQTVWLGFDQRELKVPVSMQASFLSLYQRQNAHRWLPLWLANGTDELHGDRIITAPFPVDNELFTREPNPQLLPTQQPVRWIASERDAVKDNDGHARIAIATGPFLRRVMPWGYSTATFRSPRQSATPRGFLSSVPREN